MFTLPPATPKGHIPVLQTSVLGLLNPGRDETVIDVTVGLGGHACAFAQALGPGGQLVGIDTDGENLRIAEARLLPWNDRVKIIHGNFRDIASLDLPPADIVFADLGLSSPHVDDPKRGFSFRFDGPLDLRFDRTQGESAATRIAKTGADILADALRHYGELPCPGRLARAILDGRPETTEELRLITERVYAWRAKWFMAQVFQALRMWVNDELCALESLLRQGPALLKSGGRFAIISYHSIEDRAVKHAFRELTASVKDPVTGKVVHSAPYMLLTRRPIRPSEDERASNPRSRSALLRIILRT